MTSSSRSSWLQQATCAIARLTPIPLRPRLLSLRNAHFPNGRPSLTRLLAVVVTLLMMWGLYSCTMQALRDYSRLAEHSAIEISLLIGALLGAFSAMIFLSSCVSAISSFYTSKEIDLLLASPISNRSFLVGKTWEVGFSSGWMLLTFLLPLYLAFGHSFSAGASYYVLAPVVAGSLLIVAILLGVLCAILFTAVVPAHGGRNIFILLFVAALGAFFTFLNSPQTSGNLLGATLSLPLRYQHSTIAPLRWTGVSIASLLRGETDSTALAIAVYLAAGWCLWRAVCVAHSRLFLATYSRFKSDLSAHRINSRARRALWRMTIVPHAQAIRAIVSKEFFSFIRDITHTIQLGMLLTICLLYLYNFKRLDPPTRVGFETLRAWDIFLLITNFSLGSMVVLSICSRFIFPAVSMEGASLWIVQSAPISTRDFLRAKRTGWLFPLAIIATVIFTSGGLAIGLEPILILVTTLSGLIVSYGLITVAIGLGARFAQFDWEHSAQLTTSTGNLVYMLCGITLVMISLIPAAAMFSSYILLPGLFMEETQTLKLFGSGLLILFAINYTAARVAFRVGIRALQHH